MWPFDFPFAAKPHDVVNAISTTVEALGARLHRVGPG